SWTMPAFTRQRESKKRSQRAVQRCSTFQPIVQTSTPSNNSLPNSNPSCARSPPISPIQDMGNLNGKRSSVPVGVETLRQLTVTTTKPRASIQIAHGPADERRAVVRGRPVPPHDPNN